MPGRYAAPGTLAAVGASLKTIVLVKQGATVRTRPTVVELILGFNGAPADNAFLSELRRITADGTGTAVTPEPKDPADPASNLTAAENYTAEPTAGTICMEIPQHQRTTVTLMWADESGWVIPNTANAGLALRTLHASYTGAASGTLGWRE